MFRLTILVTKPLPLTLGYRIAGTVAAWCYRSIFRRHGAALRANLSRVLGTDHPAVLDAAAERTFRNFGKYVIDFIHFPTLTRDEVQQRLRFDQWEELNAAADSERGVIIATIHFGNWDLGAAALAAFGYRINAVAETFRYPPMNDLVQGSRARLGMNIIGGDRMGPNVFRSLRRGEILAMLVDVTTEDDGIRVDFLGAPALVSPAAARIALRTNAWVVPAIVLRGPDDDLVVRPIIDIGLRDFAPTGDEAADARALTEHIMRALEPEIVRHPEQWFIFRHMWKES
jgi:KDO2-lipid IV(A) lauroyltransferase